MPSPKPPASPSTPPTASAMSHLAIEQLLGLRDGRHDLRVDSLRLAQGAVPLHVGDCLAAHDADDALHASLRRGVLRPLQVAGGDLAGRLELADVVDHGESRLQLPDFEQDRVGDLLRIIVRHHAGEAQVETVFHDVCAYIGGEAHTAMGALMAGWGS